MKRTTTTIAALIVATIATGAVAPAFAHDSNTRNDRSREMQIRGPNGNAMAMNRQGPRQGMRGEMRGGAGQILALVCSDKGADRLEHMLLGIEQRTDPTADQQPLYDTFKTAAIDAQTEFAATCETARIAPEDAGDADLVDRLQSGVALQQAHLDAMSTVLPTFEAFYDSLSDEQKAALEPRRGRGDGQRHGEQRHGEGFGKHRGGPGMAAPDAPAEQG